MKLFVSLTSIFCLFSGLGAQAAELVPWDHVVQTVSYKTLQNGKVLSFNVYAPEKHLEGPAPVHVYMHGGGWSRGRKEDVMSWVYRPVFERMSAAGVVGISIDYRLLSFENPDPNESIENCIEDTMDALRYIALNAEMLGIDPARIVVWGSSAGAHLTLISVLSKEVFGGETAHKHIPINPVCLVSWYAPHDHLAEAAIFLKTDLGTLIGHGDESALIQRFEPINYLTPSAPPMLLMHGLLDEIPAPIRFVERAQEMKLDITYIPVEGAGHVWKTAAKEPVPFILEIQDVTADYMLMQLGLIEKQALPVRLPLSSLNSN
jgi:acetyl esterase/lipase